MPGSRLSVSVRLSVPGSSSRRKRWLLRLALHQRVAERRDVARRDPDLRMHQDAGVQANDVVALLDHGAPPGALDVVLELDAERPVVPHGVDAAVDLAAREDEAATLGERHDRVEIGDGGRRIRGGVESEGGVRFSTAVTLPTPHRISSRSTTNRTTCAQGIDVKYALGKSRELVLVDARPLTMRWRPATTSHRASRTWQSAARTFAADHCRRRAWHGRSRERILADQVATATVISRRFQGTGRTRYGSVHDIQRPVVHASGGALDNAVALPLDLQPDTVPTLRWVLGRVPGARRRSRGLRKPGRWRWRYCPATSSCTQSCRGHL